MTGDHGKVKRFGQCLPNVHSILDTLAKNSIGTPMTMQILPPEECETMEQVRAGVDALDQALVRLLARRFGYMDAAARIKTDRNVVRDEARKTQVLDNVEKAASLLDLPAVELRAVWDQLVETSIAHELRKWDEIRQSAAS